jgi:hypothetical protein
MVAALSVLGLPGLGALILLIIGWGMLFCGCLNSGLGQRADFFLPHFKPSWAAKFGLGAMRSVVALFALGTGVLLFVIPALLVLAAISFWPDALMTGILVLILWTIICVVYIFPCIWADVLIVCHSPLPAQWPSNELYHRFLGAVTSHWTITRFFIISIGVAGLLAGLTYFSGQWSFRVGGRGLWLVVQSAGIFILGLTSLGLAYYFGRHVRQHASTALDIIADGR